MNRGLYERDKMLFKLLVTLKIMLVASQSFGERLGGSWLVINGAISPPNFGYNHSYPTYNLIYNYP